MIKLLDILNELDLNIDYVKFKPDSETSGFVEIKTRLFSAKEIEYQVYGNIMEIDITTSQAFWDYVKNDDEEDYEGLEESKEICDYLVKGIFSKYKAESKPNDYDLFIIYIPVKNIKSNELNYNKNIPEYIGNFTFSFKNHTIKLKRFPEKDRHDFAPEFKAFKYFDEHNQEVKIHSFNNWNGFYMDPKDVASPKIIANVKSVFLTAYPELNK